MKENYVCFLLTNKQASKQTSFQHQVNMFLTIVAILFHHHHHHHPRTGVLETDLELLLEIYSTLPNTLVQGKHKQ